MADGDKNETGKVAVNIDLGKEIDRSIAEVVTALLKPPATELGNLFADGIGMLGDIVRRKRERNAQLGLDEVRKKLEAAHVDLDAISPPKEEELHLLLTGLSLTDDENLRDMWAGLFANALNPESGIAAERPFISLLQTLSPMDAKIIDFLAFVTRLDGELRRKMKNLVPRDFSKPTDEEKEEMERNRLSNIALRKSALEEVDQKAKRYGLNTLTYAHWSDNLIRQGIIERAIDVHQPSSIRITSLDERGLIQGFEQLAKHIDYLDKKARVRSEPPKALIGDSAYGGAIDIQIRLTPFGQRFATACGVLDD